MMQTTTNFLAVLFVGLYSLTWITPPANTANTASQKLPPQKPRVLGYKTVLTTQTAFDEKTITETKKTPFKTEYREDPTLERGKEILQQQGRPGRKKYTFKVYFWQGQETRRELLEEEITPPTPQIIRRGTKLPRKMRVWAISYDGNCVGCTGHTYTGKKVRHGICAVDPNVIPLGTRFFVPGYGKCRAEDIGGAVKGKMIDLGFKDTSQGWWSSRYVTVEFLD